MVISLDAPSVWFFPLALGAGLVLQGLGLALAARRLCLVGALCVVGAAIADRDPTLAIGQCALVAALLLWARRARGRKK